jgi:hypothetical protein
MIQKPGSNIPQDPLDTLIDRTLARDAENTRSRFAILPDAQLTAKLALTTASRGLLGSLASKLALYAGAAIVVGTAIYLMPNLNQQPQTTISIPTPISQQPISKPVTQPTTEIGTKAVASHHPTNMDSATTPLNLVPSSSPPTIQLDEGDAKNIPTITDPHYRP